MAYRVAGIDVHKRMLAVVVADVDVEWEFVLRAAFVGTRPSAAGADGLAKRAGGRRSRHGIDGAILAAGLGRVRTILAAGRRHARAPGPVRARCIWRRRSRTGGAWAEERFSRRGTAGEAVGRRGVHLELCPGSSNACGGRSPAKSTIDAESGSAPQPPGGPLEEAHVKLSSLVSDLLGVSARRMLRAVATAPRTRRRSPRLAVAPARHPGAVVRRAGGLHELAYHLPTAVQDDAG